MDDSDYLCPLCCEELDISDREFYPCKCGYQVCMWCWHRIRESESGLCPACRTPYGEDPHQFSAVDVEEVLKANREREAAAKRERQKQLSNGGAAVVTSETVVEESLVAAIEAPKDRSQLANMRVIRRNLVYAVGLPPSIATEEILRKPEYFGQYGKIAKIVLNRTQAGAGADARRASASAYVTFAHKEDTLACILALDGFYMENRNVRASYGTSKYCSAFIKNVRCNNPDCTYLHEMGASEDTFTKQEIQAGYVTSGRDVLARQQQIVAEQLRLGSQGGVPRKRVGGGGPSGTGKATVTPIFPPPEFDEPSKSSPPLLPSPAGVARALTTGASVLNPATISAKLGRSNSAGNKSPPLAPVAAAIPPTKGPTTAASVVAGMHAVPAKVELDHHTTLTSLTPLKRASKPAPKTAAFGAVAVPSSAIADDMKLPSLRNGNGKKTNGIRHFPYSLDELESHKDDEHLDEIGGDVISAPHSAAASSVGSHSSINSVLLTGLNSFHDPPTSGDDGRSTLSSALGGEVFTGQLPNSSKSAIGSGKEKWGSASTVLGGDPVLSNASSGGLWHNPGNTGVIGGHVSNQGSSTSALASILGISLPTGSGSLQQSSYLWTGSHYDGQSPLAALNSSAVPTHSLIGAPSQIGSALIGGVPIGRTTSMSGAGTIGNGHGTNDVALLQSLLPGVQIASGNESITHGFSNSNWSIAPGSRTVGPGSLGGETISGWGAGFQAAPGSTIGAIGQNPGQQNQRQGPVW